MYFKGSQKGFPIIDEFLFYTLAINIGMTVVQRFICCDGVCGFALLSGVMLLFVCMYIHIYTSEYKVDLLFLS